MGQKQIPPPTCLLRQETAKPQTVLVLGLSITPPMKRHDQKASRATPLKAVTTFRERAQAPLSSNERL
ncbi:predicted protein [Botrytis cinerea T4]|uniref:Uncharacterized protein n=1 Tax=Botryotinia fuckeliana (strain T4) TaxID=999810 RepID=G2XV71_BOTF4|nr:predicted protein [Botrytis cinerea T4]